MGIDKAEASKRANREAGRQGPQQGDVALDESDQINERSVSSKFLIIREHQRKLRKILKGVLKTNVIPRIVNESSEVFSSFVTPQSRQADRDVSTFQKLILEGNHSACIEYAQRKIDDGVSLRALCLGLFATAARDLGEQWNRDELSFAEVTMGLGTLHILLHQLSARDRSIKQPGAAHNIILASAPTEQHAFGILIVSKIFEMEGWLVTGGPDMRTGNDLTLLVSSTWYDIIGLTASTEAGAYALKYEIQRLRDASLNQAVAVIVGGNGFANNPGISNTIGADEMAVDADDAILKARALLLDLQSKTEM